MGLTGIQEIYLAVELSVKCAVVLVYLFPSAHAAPYQALTLKIGTGSVRPVYSSRMSGSS